MPPPTRGEIRTRLFKFQFNFSSRNFEYYLRDLAENLAAFGTSKGVFLKERTVSIGRFQGNDYGILIESLGADSVNASSKYGHNTSTRCFKTLKFANIKGYPEELESDRKGLMLGRLVTSHHKKGQHCQSLWVVFLDETKYLWVLKARGIDEDDFNMCTARCGQCVYDEKLDTAFGANGEQNAVLLGKLSEVSCDVT
jgi:hypothetical protein